MQHTKTPKRAKRVSDDDCNVCVAPPQSVRNLVCECVKPLGVSVFEGGNRCLKCLCMLVR